MKNFKIELKWSLIYAVIFFAYILIENLLGLHNNHIKTKFFLNSLFLPQLPLLIFVSFKSIKEKKHLFFNGSISWKQACVSGIMATIFIACLNTLIAYLSYGLIFPECYDNLSVFLQSLKIDPTIKKAWELEGSIKRTTIDILSFGVVISAIIAYFSAKNTLKKINNPFLN